MTAKQRPVFPFCALQGQQHLQTALLLAAVDPLIGGVLIQGPRGTAKSTTARALADVLPHGEFVNLPLGASEEQLLGSLDIGAALKNGDVNFRPGLLARAHSGVLYVDEVNLLPDALVDLLLDVSASGINVIERDGISHQHDARFVLIGTMNPEEGELRSQLLDRFGLFIDLPAVIDAATRQQIVRTRLRFDDNPQIFLQEVAPLQEEVRQRIVNARERLSSIAFTDHIHDVVSEVCHSANVEGVRADLVLLRAARAYAALHQQDSIAESDVHGVAEWVLVHRRRPSSPMSQDTSRSRFSQPPEMSSSKSLDDRGRSAESYENHADNGEVTRNDNPWGAMAPENVNQLPLKSVRPLTTKKS